MSTPKRYNPWLVTIHWLTALLFILNLLAGTFVLKWLPNEAAKITPLASHMTIGILILVLTLVRIFVRLTTPAPAHATTGNALLDKIGILTHYLLYLGALGLGISGLGIASQAGLFQSVFGAAGQLPEDFYVFPARYGHGYLANALILLVLLHIGAALFHQFVRKDGLLSRMGYGKSQ
jgi:cytochrome b561